jgi:GTP-binding protein EngB required for normal cell division
MLGEIEEVLNSAASKAAFPRYALDISPAQRRTVEDYIARIRAQLVRILDGQGIDERRTLIAASHAIHTTLMFMDVSVEELKPKYMRGYGAVPKEVALELDGIVGELEGLIISLNRYLLAGTGEDLKARLQRLEQTGDEIELMRRVEQVVTQRGLIEFRPSISAILDRVEDKTFEIAVFGRVSSGKSSLLNAILGTSVLPVGVTPITAVPTRIRFGEKSSVTVWFAERPSLTTDVGQLVEFATEQRNPGNSKQVSRIVVELTAERLRNGVTFVDTPGLGSLATSGAAETLAYLPRCDLGVVLIDAGSALTAEDLRTILSLQEAAIPVTVLLSKADLLTEQDQERVIRYVREHIASECRLEAPVHPVSVMATHRALLDRWFEEDILPLYSRSQELKIASLKRKIGALREAVVATLQARIRRNREKSRLSQSQAREIEARLRRATGRIEEMRARREKEAERLASYSPEILDIVASHLLPSVSSQHDGFAPSGMIRDEILGSVQSLSSQMREQSESLAKELCKELTTTAQELGLPDPPREEEFTAMFREFPIFDPGELDSSVRLSEVTRLLGERISKMRLTSTLNKQIGARLQAAMKTYFTLLREWFNAAFTQLAARFDGYANRYRAEITRSVEGKELTEEEEAALLRDLQWIGGSASAAGSAERTASTRVAIGPERLSAR